MKLYNPRNEGKFSFKASVDTRRPRVSGEKKILGEYFDDNIQNRVSLSYQKILKMEGGWKYPASCFHASAMMIAWKKGPSLIAFLHLVCVLLLALFLLIEENIKRSHMRKSGTQLICSLGLGFREIST